jgi:hypothetical protein
VSTGAYRAADVAVLGPKNAWAVGNDDEGGDTSKALHGNGTKWKTVAMLIQARRLAVWAVGGDQTTSSLHWNGTSWK